MATHGSLWIEGESGELLKLHACHDGYVKDMLKTVMSLPLEWLGEVEAQFLADIILNRQSSGDNWRVSMAQAVFLDERRSGKEVAGATNAFLDGLDSIASGLTLGFDFDTIGTRIIGSNPRKYLVALDQGPWESDKPDISVYVTDDRLPLVTINLEIDNDTNQVEELLEIVNDFNSPFKPMIPWSLERVKKGKMNHITISYSPDMVFGLAVLWQALSCSEPFFFNVGKVNNSERESLRAESKKIQKRLLSIPADDSLSNVKSMFGGQGKMTKFGNFSPRIDEELKAKLAKSIVLSLSASSLGGPVDIAKSSLVSMASNDLLQDINSAIDKYPSLDEAKAIVEQTLLMRETGHKGKKPQQKRL